MSFDAVLSCLDRELRVERCQCADDQRCRSRIDGAPAPACSPLQTGGPLLLDAAVLPDRDGNQPGEHEERNDRVPD